MGDAQTSSRGASTVLMSVVYSFGYLLTASSIILLNKYVLSVTPFHFPITLSSLGVLFGWIAALVGVHSGQISLEKHGDITFKCVPLLQSTPRPPRKKSVTRRFWGAGSEWPHFHELGSLSGRAPLCIPSSTCSQALRSKKLATDSRGSLALLCYVMCTGFGV